MTSTVPKALIRLPKTGKPSKAVSKDKTRPVLLDANLRKLDDYTFQVEATNSYIAVRVPVEVEGRPEPGPIPIKALSEWEKDERREMAAVDGMFMLDDARVTYDRRLPLDPEVSSFPKVNALWPAEPARPLRLRISAKLLKAVADALGQDHVCLTLDLDAALPNGGYEKPVRVTALSEIIAADGLLMPIKSVDPS